MQPSKVDGKSNNYVYNGLIIMVNEYASMCVCKILMSDLGYTRIKKHVVNEQTERLNERANERQE